MIDQLVIFGYLLFTLWVGIYFRSNSSSTKDFLLISEDIKKNIFILIATIFSSAVGAGTIFGLTSKIISGDLSYAFGLIIAIIPDLLVAALLIPKIVRFHNFINIGDIVAKYYGDIGKLLYGITAILVSLGYLAAQISISGTIFGHFTGMSHMTGVMISYIIVITYTTIGGFRSVVITDVAQFFFMIISVPYIAFICFQNNGGTEALVNNITQISDSDPNLIKNSLSMALGFSFMSLNPTYLQRILISEDVAKAQVSSYVKCLIYLFFLLIIIVIGASSTKIISEHAGSHILSNVIDQLVPTGLKGLVFCGLLGALMSTADSNLHIASVSFVHDIIYTIFTPNPKLTIFFTRIFMVLFGIGSIFIAMKFQNVLDLIIFMAGFWGPIMFVPLVFLFYDISISKNQFLFAAVAGISVFLICEIFYSDLPISPLFLGAFTNFLIFISCLIFKRSVS